MSKNILLFGNGLCLNLLSHSKGIRKRVVTIKHKNIITSEKEISFNFENEDFYLLISNIVPEILGGKTLEDFKSDLTTKNLEEIFSEMYHKGVEDYFVSKKYEELKETEILYDGEIIFSNEYWDLNNKLKNEINTFDDLVYFLNNILKFWILKCYENLNSDNNSISRNLKSQHPDLPRYLDQFRQFDAYWTTNFMKDNILFQDIRDNDIFYVNGWIDDFDYDSENRGLIFDGFIPINRTKKSLISYNSRTDKRSAMIKKNLEEIEKYNVIPSGILGGEDYFENTLSLFGISPISDDALFNSISLASFEKIIFYYYNGDSEELTPFNEKIKNQLETIFNSFYFVPYYKIKANPLEIEDLQSHLIV